MHNELKFLHLLASRLETAGVPYMFTGSMAMMLYSEPRMTRDIDLVVEIGESDVKRVVSFFLEDCYIDEDMVRGAVRDQSMFNIIHNEWMIKADFIIRKKGAYRKEEFSRRKMLNTGFGNVWVVAPEDLILSKILWGEASSSAMQSSDVKNLLGSVRDLDWEYLKKWGSELGVSGILDGLKK